MLILERYNQLMNIDPFTNFYCLIKIHIRLDCKKFLFAVGELFYTKVLAPTSFNFISVLNNQNAIFYYFIVDKDDGDIEDLWELFDSALFYAANPLAENRSMLSTHLDIAINKKRNGKQRLIEVNSDIFSALKFDT